PHGGALRPEVSAVRHRRRDRHRGNGRHAALVGDSPYAHVVPRRAPAMSRPAVRGLKFNFLGGLGVGISLAAPTLLVHVLKMPYLLATAAAVETALLHNFVWHERFTWLDRTRASHPRQVAMRLLRFHAGNGAISIVGNLLLMRLLVGGFGLEPLI